jgi:hypothetical protein
MQPFLKRFCNHPSKLGAFNNTSAPPNSSNSATSAALLSVESMRLLGPLGPSKRLAIVDRALCRLPNTRGMA